MTGTWIGNSDGTYSDNTMTSGSESFTLPAGCLTLSGTTTTCENLSFTLASLGFASGNCTSDASSGGCACTATVDQQGGLGYVSVYAAASGMYTRASNALTDTADNAVDPYCVSNSGATLTVTPQGTTGTIVLNSSGSSISSGGSSLTGGSGSGGISPSTSSAGGSGSGGISPSTGGSSSSRGGSSLTGGSASGGISPSTGGSSNSSGGSASGGASSLTGGSSSSASISPGPCDIYAATSPATPCVAAYSTIRVLLSTYTGPLYQVRKGGANNVFNGNQPIGTVGGTTGGTTQDIGTTADGFADSAAQDAFCGTAACTVSKIYDQSGKGNNLTEAPAGEYEPGPDYEVPATHSLTVSGHKVYSLYFPAPPQLASGSAPSGYGYRNDKTSGIPTGTAAQGVYMLADATHAGTACCFDFGNAETNNGSGPTGDMAALNLGTSYWGQGAGTTPWFEGDFEAGVWAGGSSCGTPGSGQLTCTGRVANSNNPSMKGIPYAFGILKTATTNNAGQYALKAGDVTANSLKTAYSGVAPANWALQGAILLGIGGDNSNSSWGTFYEGAVTAGEPTDATDQLVYANVAQAGYGK